MKVSIITVCLNSAETIEETIKSVINQDYEHIEYNIIDGGSIDGTPNILARYQNQIQNIISEPDNGPYAAMNKGIKLSTGEVVAFLNSNDVYADNTILRKMVEFICHNDLDAAYGDLVYVDHNNTNRVTRFWKTGEYKSGTFRYGWVIPHPTFFCRRRFFEELGYFNEEFQVAADFELMLRFVEKHHIKVGYLPQTVARMRTGGKANVLRGMIRGNWEIIQSFRLNNLHVSPWFLIAKPATKISQLFKLPKS